MTGAAPSRLRLDKWLWQARFYKTRSLAARMIAGGHVRVNAVKTHKPAATVTPGDVLTFLQGRDIKVVRVVALGERRGPAPEAQALYDDLTPAKDDVPRNPGYEGKGRPTGKDRRALGSLRRSPLE
ncbi:RNA-binding S4 domain-containing protein [Alterinioella nitratireducens]|uniref:RNA-binding S4 domain-containing protein n=1 Tax=Alterinioella nitratireducens TaxID=2735915 RepID=UPI00405936E8